MPFQISKQFTFSASHQLDHLPADHQCARLHGHNYTVEVVLEADQLDELQFVVDYGRLDVFKQHLDTWFDHHHLNEVMGSGQLTTAENLAVWFFIWLRLRFKQVVEVRVSETAKTWASYRSPNFIPTASQLVGVWTKVNKALYSVLHPTIAEYADEEKARLSHLSFQELNETMPIKTDKVSDLTNLATGFKVVRLDNDRGDIRYALVTQEQFVYYTGSYLGKLDEVIRHHWNDLEETEEAAWEHLPKFPLYAAGHKSDEPPITYSGNKHA